MKFTLTLSALAALLIISSLPTTSHAYGTSAQMAKRLTPNHTLYMISYDFGFLNRETDLPIVANRDVFSDNKDTVLFDLVNASGTASTIGTTTALVVSDRPIEGNHYHLEKGKAGKFTLVVLFEHATPLPEALATKINLLPMTLTDDGKEKDFTLNAESLNEYKTPFVR